MTREELVDALETIRPELINITRLFGISDGVWQKPDYTFTAELDGGNCVIVFRHNARTRIGTAPLPADPEPRLRTLHCRRTVRRLCKQTLYRLCRDETDIHPPWGSMTGVRPTHLMLEALSEGLAPSEAEQRLIAQFDVAPDRAELLSEIARTQRLLPPPDMHAVDIYIGIPFCTTRCAYCSFSSGEIGDGRLVRPYMDALETEMRAVTEILKYAHLYTRALYVGGGTPTSLPLPELSRLLNLIGECFPGTLETTFEAGRPDTITRDKLRAIMSAGIGRICINPQTMNDRTLRVIGRAHTARETVEAYSLAREEGFRHINMDVIAGLPGETANDFRHTMDEAVRLHPESLTVHTLAIKRSSKMALENTPLPDGCVAAEMVDIGRSTARTLGLIPYYLYKQKYMAGNLENTGFALPGHACIYNVDIMEETTNILAMGAGGISKRIYPEEGHISRAPNVSNIETYISRLDLMISRKRELFRPSGDNA